ncbi:hypothetical protein FFLO_02578 [Filobasidium floriforme]|uniref:Ribosomal RNA-processing protein 14/surfeit locus protein 6 C-terminal domain-containing protein n=2 Tax=Filobasidium floriforme TaxID=5210 RepID=A0A8K0JMC0_9TREE|nr:hypothetical protein FFLO_02578 [Filobasidium floriforme]
MGTWQFDPENDKTILELQAERAALNNDDSATRLTPMTPTASISTLRQKLQDKIDSLRKGRKGPLDEVDGRPDTRGMGGETDAQPDEVASDDGSLSDGDNDTLASRDEMLEARRKKRGEVRDNRRRRRKEERRAGKEGSQKRGSEIKPGDKSKTTDFTAKPGKTSLLVPNSTAQASSSSASMIPDSNVSFPSISLPSVGGTKSHTQLKSISNPTQALAHLHAQKSKLAEMPDEKRKEIEEKERWGKMLQRAEGGKVRDDETRLKKAERRMEKQKAKSGKEWSDRKRQAEQSQAIKAKKRNEHIAARSDAKKNKKLGLKPKGDKDKGAGKAKSGYKGKKPDQDKGKGKPRPGF